MKLGIAGIAVAAMLTTGCAWWSKNGPVITADAANLAACIAVNYDQLEAAEQTGGLLSLAATIATECRADSTQLVLDVFRLLKFAKQQKAARAKAAAAPASSCGQ